MGRTPCCSVEHIKKGAWTTEEDQKLIAYIQQHGEGGWRTLPRKAGLHRCGKSCRLRWTNYLRPDIKRGEFTAQEDEKIIQLQATLGNRWSAIAKELHGRTDNEIKNYWNTHLKKRISNMGTTRQINGAVPLESIVAPPLTINGSDSTEEGNHDNDNTCNYDSTEVVVVSSATDNPSSNDVPHLVINVDDVEQGSSCSNNSSSTSKFLNKLAGTKLVSLSSTCLNAITSTDAQCSKEGDGSNNDNNQDPVSRPVSRFSAKLLNKMASRVGTPTICRDAVKSIVLSNWNTTNNNNVITTAGDHQHNQFNNVGVVSVCTSSSSEVSEMSSTFTSTLPTGPTIVNSTEPNNNSTDMVMTPDILDLDDFFRDLEANLDGCEIEGGHINVAGPCTILDHTYTSVESPTYSMDYINYYHEPSTSVPCHDLPEVYWTL